VRVPGRRREAVALVRSAKRDFLRFPATVKTDRERAQDRAVRQCGAQRRRRGNVIQFAWAVTSAFRGNVTSEVPRRLGVTRPSAALWARRFAASACLVKP